MLTLGRFTYGRLTLVARWVLVGCLAVTSACYEWVFVDCPPPTPTRALPLRRDSTQQIPPGTLTASVLVSGASVPAEFELWSGQQWTPVAADSAGDLRLSGLAAGMYVLRTRRVGLPVRVDTVALRENEGVAVIQPFQADEFLCTPVYVQRRRPWWKVW